MCRALTIVKIVFEKLILIEKVFLIATGVVTLVSLLLCNLGLSEPSFPDSNKPVLLLFLAPVCSGQEKLAGTTYHYQTHQSPNMVSVTCLKLTNQSAASLSPDKLRTNGKPVFCGANIGAM